MSTYGGKQVKSYSSTHKQNPNRTPKDNHFATAAMIPPMWNRVARNGILSLSGPYHGAISQKLVYTSVTMDISTRYLKYLTDMSWYIYIYDPLSQRQHSHFFSCKHSTRMVSRLNRWYCRWMLHTKNFAECVLLRSPGSTPRVAVEGRRWLSLKWCQRRHVIFPSFPSKHSPWSTLTAPA